MRGGVDDISGCWWWWLWLWFVLGVTPLLICCRVRVRVRVHETLRMDEDIIPPLLPPTLYLLNEGAQILRLF